MVGMGRRRICGRCEVTQPLGIFVPFAFQGDHVFACELSGYALFTSNTGGTGACEGVVEFFGEH